VYEVDDKDRVRELGGLPQSSIGAPIPLLLADEFRSAIAYVIQDVPDGWDGTTVRVIGPSSGGLPIALVTFELCHAQMFGPPNDEVFSGHPLAARGLAPYGAFEVTHSSWIRKLERMNSVHEHHRPERFLKYRHIILAFHDSTFECVCDDFRVALWRGSMTSVVPEMVKALAWRAG
jgi:hypothetical protein